jgi:hypothetical protein
MIRAIIVAIVLAAGSSLQAPPGKDIIHAMYDRYAGEWYEKLALVQTVSYYDSESAALDSVRVWYESILLPGTVRSDIAPLDAGNRQVYRDGTWTDIRADSVIRSFPGPHPILLLGFDVYVQPVEETLAKLEQLRIDLSQVRVATWEGREVYVVGDESRQFWIDCENLLFVRLLLTNPDTGSQREVRMKAYEPLGGGWIATELAFMRDGRVDIHERYDYWTIDVDFDPRIFALDEPVRPAWVKN